MGEHHPDAITVIGGFLSPDWNEPEPWPAGFEDATALLDQLDAAGLVVVKAGTVPPWMKPVGYGTKAVVQVGSTRLLYVLEENQ